MSVAASFPARAQQRVAAFNSYRPGRPAETIDGKLSSNEAPLGPAPVVRAAINEAAKNINRYPEAGSLVERIAAQESVDPATVVVTNGSDELCYVLAMLFVAPGATVVLSDPCYQIDDLVSRVQGGRPVRVPVLADGSQDLEGMAAAAADASILWLPTPHNPTGVAVAPEELDRLLEAVPQTCLVVVDEAYRAYADPVLRPASRELIARHPNVLVQRTFSKDYGLAGLRIGYGLGAPELIDALNRVKPPFNVNAVAIAAAQAAIDSQDWCAYGIELVLRERARLERTLEELRVEFYASQANFVTFKPPSVGTLQTAFSLAGLVARDGADLGLPGWMRVSVGSPAVMARLRAVLEKTLGQPARHASSVLD
ncbi:MAG: pyridoxal phosphate-dependent aminotransferase [Trebonia sp.]